MSRLHQSKTQRHLHTKCWHCLCFISSMIVKTLAARNAEKKNIDFKCSTCGMEIFPAEIYYTLCVHMETREANTDNIDILEIRPLAFRCRLCEEKGIRVC